MEHKITQKKLEKLSFLMNEIALILLDAGTNHAEQKLEINNKTTKLSFNIEQNNKQKL